MPMRKPIIPDDEASKCFFYKKNIQGGFGLCDQACVATTDENNRPPLDKGGL